MYLYVATKNCLKLIPLLHKSTYIMCFVIMIKFYCKILTTCDLTIIILVMQFSLPRSKTEKSFIQHFLHKKLGKIVNFIKVKVLLLYYIFVKEIYF